MKNFKTVLLICCCLFISVTAEAAEINTREIPKELLITPDEYKESLELYNKQRQQEIEQNILIGVVIIAVIIIAVAKFRKTRRYKFAKDYAYMLKLIKIAKDQNTPEHSTAVLCRGEKSVSVENEIYAFCITHENLNEVVRRHNATLSDFKEIYNGLTMFCCVDSGDKFIPVSTFFFTRSLEYVLSNRITDYNSGNKVAGNLIKYFDSML